MSGSCASCVPVMREVSGLPSRSGLVAKSLLRLDNEIRPRMRYIGISLTHVNGACQGAANSRTNHNEEIAKRGRLCRERPRRA